MTTPIKIGKRQFPVDVFWCGTLRRGSGAGWSFPPMVEKFLVAECKGTTVLHPFGGRSRFGTRMDIDPIVRPDVLADAWLPPFGRDSFDVVILDPPYTQLNAQEKTALFRQYIWIARKRIIWFHTIWTSVFGGVKQERAWLVRVGDHCQVRCLQYFLPREPKLPPVTKYSRGPGMIYNRWMAQPRGLFDGADPLAVTIDATNLLPAEPCCPLCRVKVISSPKGYRCGRCKRFFPFVNGIPNFLLPEAHPQKIETA